MEPRDPPSDTMGRAECAACGRPVPSERIRVLARRDDLTFAELPCSGCGSTGLAIFLTDDQADTDPTGALALGGWQAITADEVLDMHEFLAAWTGDLRGLVDKRPRDRSGDGSGPA